MGALAWVPPPCQVHRQSFNAQIWVEFIVEGGARDPDLSAKGEVFPIGADGKPTFRPSLAWYMAQVDMRNALTFRVVDAKTMTRDHDLVMAMRMEGCFAEIYELERFPFDQQGLTVMINFNCRVGGPLPMEISVAENCKVVLSCVRVCPPSKEWEVAPELSMRAFNLGAEDGVDRIFPAISFTAMVRRRPFFYVVNLTVPMGADQRSDRSSSTAAL